MPASTQTRVIRVKADVSGSQELKAMADYMARLNGNVKNLSNSFGFLKNAFVGYLSLNGLRQIVGISDTMQNLNSRLVTITGSQEAATKTMESLLRVANQTNSSISGTAESYARLAIALKGAGASQESIVQLTKVLTNSFRLSGSTVTETTNTIIQLSQAFASGQLRGQELRSVMEQNAVVAELLRKKFGTDIYKKAAEGAISVTEVLRALRGSMDEINQKAELLTPTFEQTLTRAFNGFKVSLLQVNEQLGLARNFAKAIDFVTVSLGTLARVGTDLAIVLRDELDWKAITASAIAFAAIMAPLASSFVLVAGAAIYTSDSVGDLVDKFRNLAAWFVQVKITALEAGFALEKGFAKILFKVGLGSKSMVEDLALSLDEINDFKKVAQDLGTPKYRPSPLLPEKDNSKKVFDDLLSSLEKYYKAGQTKLPKVKDLLAELNQQYRKIGAQEYYSALVDFNFKKLSLEFQTGKINLDAFNKGIQELNRQDINRAFTDGTILLQEFNQAISQSKLKDLKTDLEAGKISLIEYRSEFVKLSEEFSIKGSFQAGAANYITSIGTVGQQTAQAIQNAFSGLETVFTDFVKTGKFNFNDFTRSVLDDLTKIIIRASIIKPLANAVLDFGGGGGGSGVQATNADFSSTAAFGNAYDRGNVIPFAKGGVVGSPTTFGMSKGRTGLMGEAGPEAILPLARGDGGKLGVQAQVTPVTINIVNQAGAEVQQKETTGPNGERMIDIIIAQKVKEQFANGTYDKTLRSQYGLTRKGQ